MVGATGYGPGSLAAQSVRGLSVERGRAARLKLDLTHTQVPIVQLYEAGTLSETIQMVKRKRLAKRILLMAESG